MASTLIPLGVLLFYYRVLNKPLKLLLILLLISFTCDTANTLLALNGINNIHIFNFYSLAEGVLVIMIYHNILTTKALKNTASIFLVVIIISMLFGFIESKSFLKTNSILTITELLLILMLSLLFFYELLQKLVVSNLYEYYFFWINSGLLLMSSLSMFLLLFERYIEGNKALTYLWLIFYFANIIFRLLLLKGIWKFLSQKI